MIQEMSEEKRLLEQIEQCSNRTQNLIIEYSILSGDVFSFPGSVVSLEEISQEAVSKIVAIQEAAAKREGMGTC